MDVKTATKKKDPINLKTNLTDTMKQTTEKSREQFDILLKTNGSIKKL